MKSRAVVGIDEGKVDAFAALIRYRECRAR